MIEVTRVESDVDVERWLAVWNGVDPLTPVTRRRFETRRHRREQLELLAFLDGSAAGAATAARQFADPHGPLCFTGVRVLAEARRRGVGSALLAAVGEHARACGRSGLYTLVRDDDCDSLAYFAKRGFREVLRMQESVLELARATPEVAHVEGIELVRLEGRPELERPLYDAALEIERDLVAATAWETGSFDEWRERQLGPRMLLGCSFAAVAGDEVVGYTILEDDGEGIGGHSMTGVRRAWRSRGVASALKRAQIEAAREAGLRELRARNEVGNAPMRGVNARLGYVPRLLFVHLSGPLLS